MTYECTRIMYKCNVKCNHCKFIVTSTETLLPVEVTVQVHCLWCCKFTYTVIMLHQNVNYTVNLHGINHCNFTVKFPGNFVASRFTVTLQYILLLYIRFN